MGYEKEVLARARRRHQEAVAQFQRTQRERRERVYREYPRVQEIDQQLRRTMAEFMAETFRNGQDRPGDLHPTGGGGAAATGESPSSAGAP